MSFWTMREQFRHWMGRKEFPMDGSTGADAVPEAMAPLNEKLIQMIWAQQLFYGESMRTLDGRPVRVLDPGRWNESAGPDFKQARLILGDGTFHGDVEIHIDAADWQRHGHHRDLDYNQVGLHVVLESGGEEMSDHLHNGETIPRLVIEPYIFPDLETLRRSISMDDFHYQPPPSTGRCFRLMTESDPAMIAGFLDHAGSERLITKMRRLEDMSGPSDPEQVFYQAWISSLGSGTQKTLYYLLAKRIPLKECLDEVQDIDPADRTTALESLILHVAGLVPAEYAMEKAPETVRSRAAELRQWWMRFKPWWQDRVIPPSRRWFKGVRPANFPTRRLAGVAVLLNTMLEHGRTPLQDLVDEIRNGLSSLENSTPSRRKHPMVASLTDVFRVRGGLNPWRHHYSFTAENPSVHATDLIGEKAAMSLVFNALLPAALMIARKSGEEELARGVQQLYNLFPTLQENHITAFMTRRLFGDNSERSGFINTERRRQALFQIFHHCCNSESGHCDACYFLQPDP
jgi:hypothetical protein